MPLSGIPSFRSVKIWISARSLPKIQLFRLLEEAQLSTIFFTGGFFSECADSSCSSWPFFLPRSPRSHVLDIQVCTPKRGKMNFCNIIQKARNPITRRIFFINSPLWNRVYVNLFSAALFRADFTHSITESFGQAQTDCFTLLRHSFFHWWFYRHALRKSGQNPLPYGDRG